MIIYKSIIALFFWISCANLFGRNLEVCASCPLSSLTTAIEQAVSGDTITVQGGHYREGNIIVNKPLTIIGVDDPVFDGENETEVITIVANHVWIEGITIQNVGTSYLEDRAGLRVKKSRHFTLINNRLLNTFFGIYLEYASHGRVEGNELIGDAKEESSSGNAIHLWYCKHIHVLNNEVSHHRDGIYFEFVDSSFIRGNLSHHNLRYGLHFMFSNNDEYDYNTFRENGAGVAVMFSKWISMRNNQFERNWGKASFGLLLKEIYDAEIVENHFEQNTIGIFVEGSTRINYLNNEFLNNGWAVKMSGGCLDNVMSRNNFMSNTFDLAVASNINNNTFNGNHWSSYTGYDLDKDGIGDIPYRPVKLFNYVVQKTPEAMVLLRSLFVDLINFSEKVSPVFTPKNVIDETPAMKPNKVDRS